MKQVKVVFRKYKSDGDILAVFPHEYHNERLYGRSLLVCYEHIGQHGSVAAGYIQPHTVPAKPKEYAALLAELQEIYRRHDGVELTVLQRMPKGIF